MIEPLPSIEFIIKGDTWRCIGTADTEDGVIDTIKNLSNNEIRKAERMRLVKYLEKNAHKIESDKKINVYLNSNNNQLNINL
jgi:hypothetical protein